MSVCELVMSTCVSVCTCAHASIMPVLLEPMLAVKWGFNKVKYTKNLILWTPLRINHQGFEKKFEKSKFKKSYLKLKKTTRALELY